ncbi:MAG: MarR family transcriptional regulator [Pirellulaceae bacterium]|nr:MarR family transcriptional regulator [Pirellulaceae bacterium]
MADAVVTSAGMRIVKLLVGKPPQTVDELTKAAGVTRTAVTQQIRELEQGGLVERTTERLAGRGRPRNRFYATESALMLLCAGQDNLLGRALWNAIEDAGGDELIKTILDRVSSQLADHYRDRVTAKTPAGRLEEMNRILHDEGLLVEVVKENSHVSLHKRSCSFIGMFEENRRVCYVDQKVLSLVVGEPVHRTACRLDGDPCCIYQVDTKTD